jgi:hypothetical protein
MNKLDLYVLIWMDVHKIFCYMKTAIYNNFYFICKYIDIIVYFKEASHVCIFLCIYLVFEYVYISIEQ